LARDFDLLLSIFPFEKEWYAGRVPKLRVDFVGHPMLDRFTKAEGRRQKVEGSAVSPSIVLLPGSRADEVRRHLPVMLDALKLIQAKHPEARATMVLPNDSLAQQSQTFSPPSDLEIQVGRLPEMLAQAEVAVASTGTVTMECAFFGVPTVTLYKTSWSSYAIGRRIVTVKWLTMPNLLANEEIFPEFVQHLATSENIAQAAMDLMNDKARRETIQAKLARIVASLGGPGANARAASAILRLLP
jgi:lipid-A-disaccharide synthase